jgi:hypothetical protein
MRAPLLLSVAGAIEIAPLVAAALFRRALRGPRGWTVGWAAVQVVEEVGQVWLGLTGKHNLWVGYLGEPASAALLLWALAGWQVSPVVRLTIKLAIAPVLVTFVVLTLAFDTASSFSRAAQPMLFLVCLVGAAFTLVARSRVAEGELLRQDWFWICGGLVLYYGTFSALFPLSRLLLAGDLVLFVRAYELANVMAAVSFLAVARGIACPTAT